MKRLIAVLVVVALVMTGAFAQISFGAWGRGAFVPVEKAAGEEDLGTETSASWGWGGPRIGFTLAASSDNFGIQVDMKADGGADVVVGDNAKIWWQANDMFKVSIGKITGDAMRGKIGDVPLRRWVGPCLNEDNIFTRFFPKNGALVEITPVDGLYIGAAVDTGAASDGGTTGTAIKSVYTDSLQAAVGYNLDGVGLIRAQYVGGAVANDDVVTVERVEFAFAPAFIDGVALDLGVKIPLADAKPYNAVVGVGTNFAIGDVGVWGRADAKFMENETTVDAYVVPSVGLDFATIGCDLSVSVDAKDKNTYVGFGAAPWIQKGYSNGYVKAAFAVKQKAEKDAKLGWAVPVIFEYWF